MPKKEKRPDVQPLTIRGFGRVQLVNVKTGKIEGDSGWKGNVVTEVGFQDYLCRLLGNIANSKQAIYMALGSGTSTNSTFTELVGEHGGRQTGSNSVVSSKTMRMTAQWDTDEGNASAIGSLGAYNTSSGGTVMNALSVATSQKTTDQQLNCTLDFAFS